MKARLDDYYALIGKLTIAAATLEEVVLRWAALLQEDNVEKIRYDNLTKGLESNLTLLARRVTERVSHAAQKSVLDLIEKGRELKNKRNENVHGVWAEMKDPVTGKFVEIARARYEKDRATRKTEWDLSVPGVEELEKLAADIRTLANELNERLAHLWDMNEDVQGWRRQHGY